MDPGVPKHPEADRAGGARDEHTHAPVLPPGSTKALAAVLLLLIVVAVLGVGGSAGRSPAAEGKPMFRVVGQAGSKRGASGTKWGLNGKQLGRSGDQMEPSGDQAGTNWDQVGTTWDQVGTKRHNVDSSLVVQ